ncbi:MAG: hypothetical protein KGL53_13035, partial [Elusimicrobia bacterium]|nr:hypothetical protein [Elusimicrobiota bacterium]
MRLNVACAMRDPNRGGVLLEALSRNGYTTTVVQRAKELSSLLSQKPFDMLLVGQQLADADGLETVKTLRGRGPTRSIAIVALLDHQPPPPMADIPGVRRLPAGFGAPAPRPSVPAGGAAAAERKPGNPRVAFFQAGADECLTLDQDV